MNKKSILEVIKNILLLGEEKETLSFVEAELVDGTKIEVSALEVGGSVEVITPEGEKSPAPDAEYELSDGTKVVTVGGLITEIKEKEMKDEEMEGDPKDAKIAELEAKIKELEGKFSEALSGIEKLNSANIELAKEFDKLAKSPAAESINLRKEKSYSDMTPYEKFMFEKEQKRK
jgi:hypothetical protein